MNKLTTTDISYLRDRAKAAGYNADDMLKVINYESSGRPDVWGGKGGKYFGLLQFGPAERKQFGVDTVNPNARNQIDAGFRFLEARGFKPGMGVMDMYSTVLAGSPGHYNRSDGAGTVASHVAKMQGAPQPAAPINITPALTSEKKTDPIGDLIAAGYDPQKIKDEQDLSEISDYGMGLLNQANAVGQIIAPPPPMQPMGAPILPPTFVRPRPARRGLLG
jgi:hypothetical protein